jgi:hypothetical protein
VPTDVADLQAYWQELAKKANLPEDKAKLVSDALADETVQRTFRNGFRAMPDYSRDMDSVRDRTRAETSEAVKAYYDKWYQSEALPVLTRKEQEAANYKAAVDQYRQLYGDIDGNANGNGQRQIATPSGDFLSKSEFQEFMRAREQAEINVLKAGLNAASHHMHVFGKPLDVDAVLRTANEKGLTFDQAYQSYVAPELEKRTKDQHAEELKRAREEGARDERSRMKIPVDSGPRELHPFFDRETTDPTKPAPTERDSMAAFIEGWHEAAERQNNK